MPRLWQDGSLQFVTVGIHRRSARKAKAAKTKVKAKTTAAKKTKATKAAKAKAATRERGKDKKDAHALEDLSPDWNTADAEKQQHVMELATWNPPLARNAQTSVRGSKWLSAQVLEQLSYRIARAMAQSCAATDTYKVIGEDSWGQRLDMKRASSALAK